LGARGVAGVCGETSGAGRRRGGPPGGGGGMSRDWPLWEVFVRSRRGLSHTHVGSLHAPDAQMALRNARDVYTRRQEGVSIWVVPAAAITASSPEEKDSFFAPAADKIYRHPTFYDIPGQVEGHGRTEDDLAYFRDERQFSNLHIVELDNGDFAQTMARQLLFSSYQLELYRRLQKSRDETLAGVAGKAVKEVAYHRDHATQWTLRLGDGTDESHRRMQAGVERV